MRLLIVDRTEGPYTLCEDADQRMFAIETAEMPEGAVPGTAIRIDDTGAIAVDEAETAARKKRIAEKQGRLTKK